MLKFLEGNISAKQTVYISIVQNLLDLVTATIAQILALWTLSVSGKAAPHMFCV
jgi:hypothetical protein